MGRDKAEDVNTAAFMASSPEGTKEIIDKEIRETKGILLFY